MLSLLCFAFDTVLIVDIFDWLALVVLRDRAWGTLSRHCYVLVLRVLYAASDGRLSTLLFDGRLSTLLMVVSRRFSFDGRL
eukprot:2868871-Pleurochrysis_carterae.AAC.1